MDTLIKDVEYKKHTIEIHSDYDFYEDPREWSDHLGTIISKKLPNECEWVNPSDRDAVLDRIRTVEKNNGIVLPIYCYSHGIDRYRTRDFSDVPLPQGHYRFDTFLAGFIYAELDKIREWYGVKRVTEKVREKAKKSLEAEIREIDYVSSGQVYGYKLFDEKGEEIDSCWGWIGDSDSMLDEVKSNVDYILQKPHTREPVVELLGA